MAIYTVSVTHALVLDDAVEQKHNRIDVVAAMADDLDCTDGRIIITIQHFGTVAQDPLSGTLAAGTAMIDSVYAIREFPSQREIEQSNGKIRITDRKFHYKASAASFVPEVGDYVIAQGVTLEIVAFDIQTLGTRYLVYCRA